MQPAEAEFFSVLLKGSDPAWIVPIDSLAGLTDVIDTMEGRARLISFCSDIIVPRQLLSRLDGDCLNFHPGPPERPGYRPAAFAAAERATSFGITLHRMIEEIDAGPIFAVERFSIAGLTNEEAINTETYGRLLWLAAGLADRLGNPTCNFSELPERWGNRRTRRSDYEALVRHSA